MSEYTDEELTGIERNEPEAWRKREGVMPSEPLSNIEPPFEVGVPILLGADEKGDLLVYEGRSFTQMVMGSFGKLADKFGGAAIRENPAFEVKTYTQKEFANTFPDFEEQGQRVDKALDHRTNLATLREGEIPISVNVGNIGRLEGVNIVTLEQYKRAHELIEGNAARTNSSVGYTDTEMKIHIANAESALCVCQDKPDISAAIREINAMEGVSSRSLLPEPGADGLLHLGADGLPPDQKVEGGSLLPEPGADGLLHLGADGLPPKL